MESPPELALAPTIVGIATPLAEGGVGIIRVSGAYALALTRSFVQGLPEVQQARHAYRVTFTDAKGGPLDDGLFLYFKAPHSYTGEDVVELQMHGSPRLLTLMQGELLQEGRARLAEPGEFTQRAFLNGRMDLARAEAVADLIAARSEAAVRAAAAQLRGGLSSRIAALQSPLTALRADVEAVLSFPEEAEEVEEEFAPRLTAVLEAAQALVRTATRGERIRRGARVVLFGPVNAGKSTLFNALLGESRALVDSEPGTTRDVLEANLELGGLAVVLADTAGLRDGPGRVEALGMARARGALQSADLAVLVIPPGAACGEVDLWRDEAQGVPLLEVHSKADLPNEVPAGRPPDAPNAPARWSLGEGGTSKEQAPLQACRPGQRLAARKDADGEARPGLPHDPHNPPYLLNQGEDEPNASPERQTAALGERALQAHRQGPFLEAQEDARGRSRVAAPGQQAVMPGKPLFHVERISEPLSVSGATGSGVSRLKERLKSLLWGEGIVEGVQVTSDRHRILLEGAVQALKRAQLAMTLSTLEVVAGELAAACEALGQITGEDAQGALVDEIFRRFCIGK